MSGTSRTPVSASLQAIRRLAVTKQHLAGPLPSRATEDSILSLTRDLGYVQWDPVTIVAPSHLISLWSRLGPFRAADLDRLLWVERKLLLHWTPVASIVLTEDYPLFGSLMSRYPESLTRSWGSHRTRAKEFLAQHQRLRSSVLAELRAGPRKLGEFADHARTKRNDGDWSPGSDVSLMLFHLLMSGEVMVVGHEGAQNLWGLTEQFLPGSAQGTVLGESEFERRSAQRAIRALGTASPREITYYFVRGRYQNLRSTLARLSEEGAIHRVTVEGLTEREERYVHDQDLPLLESMEDSTWHPRMSLLPPFDNMICSTARTSRVFGFDYVREQFLPKEKRRFGTYVLPILAGDRFIGRIDPQLDKKSRTLVVQAVHAEPTARLDREEGKAVDETVHRFASFLGADRVTYSSKVPKGWKSALR